MTLMRDLEWEKANAYDGRSYLVREDAHPKNKKFSLRTTKR